MVAGRYFGLAIILIATPEPDGPNQQPPFLPPSPSVRGPESVVGGVGAKDIIKPLFSLLKGNGNEGDGRCGDGDGRPAAFPVIQRMKSRGRERQNPRQISTTFTG